MQGEYIFVFKVDILREMYFSCYYSSHGISEMVSVWSNENSIPTHTKISIVVSVWYYSKEFSQLTGLDLSTIASSREIHQLMLFSPLSADFLRTIQDVQMYMN